MKQPYFIFSKHSLLLIEHNHGYDIPHFHQVPPWLVEIYQHHEININLCSSFVIEVNMPTQNHIIDGIQYCWQPLKFALNHLPLDLYGLTSKAYQIIQWENNHRFCGKCGQPTIAKPQQFERHCQHCHLYFYPRISPSIIVLIQKQNQLLLARRADFAKGIYGLIAGFVEVGETLEQAVHREVLEEVGITVTNLHYFGSQPWPFPDSLMIGFTADYASGEITLPDGELEHAGWYSADNLPGFPSSSVSIATKMIEHFVEKQSLCS